MRLCINMPTIRGGGAERAAFRLREQMSLTDPRVSCGARGRIIQMFHLKSSALVWGNDPLLMADIWSLLLIMDGNEG